MSRILITGMLGTIGLPLSRELERRGHQVYGIDHKHSHLPNVFRADVANYRELEDLFLLGLGYDYVYHLAAEFGRINGEEYYESLWRTNAIGTRNILELQKKRGFNLIFASSSEIYGEQNHPHWLHENLSNEIPILQPNDYALSKWVNEVQIMNFEKRYGSPIMRLRFFNAYGPGEFYHAYRSVVCLFCYRALHGLPWTVYRNYHRVFMYIDDFIPTLANAVNCFKAGQVLNIGGDEYRSVEHLSDIVREHTNANPELVTYLDEDRHNIVNKRPDITQARAFLGHDPKVTLEEGVPKTLEWMRSVYGI